MLDDEKFIHQLDKSNALGVIAGQLEQLKQDFEINPPESRADNLVIVGMGGSALAGDFVRSWLSDKLTVPLEVVRDYSLPGFVGPQTAVVISSYSGNTAETLAALDDAKKRGAQIFVMTSGGQLAEIAEAEGYPVLALPAGLQPRMAVLYGVKALANLVAQIDQISSGPTLLEQAVDRLAPELSNWISEVPTVHNQAKRLAEQLLGFNVVVYAGPTLAVPGLMWKIGFNENAKNVAFFYPWSEFNHNEFTGWVHPREKRFRVIELQSDLDRPEMAKRFEISNRLLSGKMPNPIIIRAKGETKLDQMLWMMLLGGFVSTYLAILNRVDPTSVELIEKLKKELQT